MKIAIGCDEMGYELKQTLITRLKEKNIEFTDFGSFEDEKVLYPSIAEKVALEVKNNDYDRGFSFAVQVLEWPLQQTKFTAFAQHKFMIRIQQNVQEKVTTHIL